jgi:hypothetical protein
MATGSGHYERLQQLASESRNEQGAPSGPRTQVTNYACPKCKSMGQPKNRLSSTPGRYALTCAQGHQYPDMADLMMMNPDILDSLPQAPRPLQPGFCKYEVQIPEEMKARVEAKYGKRLVPSLAAILSVMVEPDAFLVSQPDAIRLADIFQEKVRDPNKLVGNIQAMVNERNELRSRVQHAAAAESPQGVPSGYAPMPGFTNVMLQFDEDTMDKLREKATFNSLSTKKMTVTTLLQESIPKFIADGWF